MRNLKKVLALVLALVMALGLMSVASAKTTFDDAADVTAKYSEAVQVLGGLDVFQGKNTPGNFAPKDTITRAEVAAIIYRLVTDKDKQASIYASGTDFADVKADDWFSGYVCYCYNAQYMVGDKTNFYPSMQVTGYQALAMILRAIGYRENNDFQGAGWEIRAASTARELGILKNVSESELVGPASRELVAEILFRAAIVPQVKYTSINGYTQYKDTLVTADSEKNDSLAWATFGLAKTGRQTIDSWGRPGYIWYKESADVEYADAEFTPADDTLVATIAMTPTVVYDGYAVKECDVAHDLGLVVEQDFQLYVNGSDTVDANGDVVPGYVTNGYKIVPTDVTTQVGMQGRRTEFYYEKVGNNVTLARAVMIDTMLAQVVSVRPHTEDAKGHVITGATLELAVYDHAHTPDTADTLCNNLKTGNADGLGTAGKDDCPLFDTVILRNGANDWTYTKGQFLLLKTWTRANNPAADNPNDVAINDADGNEVIAAAAGATYGSGRDDTTNAAAAAGTAIVGKQKEAAAFQTDKVVYYDAAQNIAVPGYAVPWELSVPTNTTGKQSTIYWSAAVNKHQVAGTDYSDANTLFYDKAGQDVGAAYVWFFDSYGNIIGIDDSPVSVNYGVINSMYFSNSVSSSATDGGGVAVADVQMSDGSTKSMNISSFLMNATNALNTDAAYGDKNVAATAHLNPMMTAVAGLDADAQVVATAGNDINVVELRPLSADGSQGAHAMDTEAAVPKYDLDTSGTAGSAWKPVQSQFQEWLWVSTSTANNTAMTGASVAGTNYNDVYDILNNKDQLGNLYQFRENADGTYTAVEVAGTDENTGIYAGHQNGVTDGGDDLTIKKSAVFSGIDTVAIKLDASTVFMVYSQGTGKYTISKMSEMPGDLVITKGTEVDWADTNRDGTADIVFCLGRFTGANVDTLLYLGQGSSYSWTPGAPSGTISGYFGAGNTLETKTIANSDVFDDIKAAMDDPDYNANIFAVRLEGDVIVDGFGATAGNAYAAYKTTPAESVTLATTPLTAGALDISALNKTQLDSTTGFQTGIAGGNTFVKAADAPGDGTSVVFYDAGATEDDSGAFVSYSRGVLKFDGKAADDAMQYVVTGNTKVVGSLDDDTLARSYVTIVYNSTSVADTYEVIALYINPYKITPGTDTAPAGKINIYGWRVESAKGRFELNLASTVAVNKAADTLTVKITDTVTGNLLYSQAGIEPKSSLGADGTLDAAKWETTAWRYTTVPTTNPVKVEVTAYTGTTAIATGSAELIIG